MDMFVPIYEDFFDFQERSKTMYREIVEDIALIEHHQNVLNTLKKFGYSKPLIDSVGGEAFTTSIRINQNELDGKDALSKKSVYVANLMGWLKEKLRVAVNKILEFIRWLLDKIAEWFHRPNPREKANVSRLTMINTFPAGMQVPNVFQYQEFITRLSSLRNLVTYINGWFTQLNEVYAVIQQNPQDAATRIKQGFGSYQNAVTTFVKEISHNHYRDGVVPTSNGCQVVVPTTSPDPVNPVEFGWNGGSQIRYAGSLITTIMSEIAPVEESLSTLNESIIVLGKNNPDPSIQGPIAELLNITGYVLNTASSLCAGVRDYDARFFSMTEWIIQEIQKKK